MLQHRITQQVALPADESGASLATAYRDVAAQKQTAQPPLVLVHGYTGSSLDFQDQMPPLAQRRRVLAPDHRGHGDSDNIGPYSISQLSQDLIGFLDAMDITQCDLLGHSMGGMVSLDSVLAHPQRFRSLLLMDTSADPIRLMNESTANQLSATAVAHGCQALVPMMRTVPPSSAVTRAIEHLGEAEHWRRIETKLQHMDPVAFQQFGQALGDHQTSASKLGTITCPVTILVGAADKPFQRPSQHLHRCITQSKLVVIPKAAHSPQYENPEVWLHEVLNHLAQLG